MESANSRVPERRRSIQNKADLCEAINATPSTLQRLLKPIYQQDKKLRNAKRLWGKGLKKIEEFLMAEYGIDIYAMD